MLSLPVAALSLWSVRYLLAVSAAPSSNPDFTFTRSTLPINITSLGDDGNSNDRLQLPTESLTYGCHKTVSETLNDRDFYLNSIGLVRLLALGSHRGNETPKIVHREDAKSVVVKVGGGRLGNDPMPRQRMLQVVAGLVDAVTSEYGFNPLLCDVYLGDHVRGTPVGRYESAVVDDDSASVPPDQTDIVEPQDDTSLPSTSRALAGGGTDVLPRCPATFSASNVISIGDFFNIVSVGMVSMSDWGADETIGVLDFRSPIYKLEVRIRGVRETATTFFLRPMDVINTLFVLVLQELLRVDNLGLPYNTVFTRIFRNLPRKGDTQIGTLGITTPKELSLNDSGPEDRTTF